MSYYGESYGWQNSDFARHRLGDTLDEGAEDLQERTVLAVSDLATTWCYTRHHTLPALATRCQHRGLKG